MGEELQVAQPPNQPELFGDFPSDPRLLECVRKKSFVRSGKLLSQQEQRCRAICLDIIFARASGLLSDREIAARHRVSRNDLPVVVEIMRQRGELEPLTKLINADLDMNTWLMGRRINEGLLDGTIHPGQLPIPWLAAIDKRAQRDAGLVPGTELVANEVKESALQAARRTWEAARAAAALPVDSGSTAHAAQVIAVQATDAPAVPVATGPATGNALQTRSQPASMTPAEPAHPAPTPVATAPAKEGGGGVAISPPGLPARGDGPENFTP